jgi:predicted DCC family thiol-disulfide oxidoreductase YuxK
LFDGVCNFCNAYVNTIIDFDPEAKFRFASLQSKVGQALLILEGKAPTDISSIILAEKDTYYTKSDAVLRVAEKLPELQGYERVASFGLIVPRFLRDSIYEYVSKNRYKFMGERDECRLTFGDEEDDFAKRFIEDSEVMEVIENQMSWGSN